MANTYSQIYIQTVFAVKYRQAMIDMDWKNELCVNIGNIINEMGCKNYIVNGVEDQLLKHSEIPYDEQHIFHELI